MRDLHAAALHAIRTPAALRKCGQAVTGEVDRQPYDWCRLNAKRASSNVIVTARNLSQGRSQFRDCPAVRLPMLVVNRLRIHGHRKPGRSII